MTKSNDDICERCDKPRIPDSAWHEAWANADDNQTMRQWRDSVVSAWPGHCDARQVATCTEQPIDWRARAKKAEAKLAEVDWPTIYDNAGGLRDRIATLEAQLQHARQTCNGSCDIALARRQVGPDGDVPGNARECAEMWEREAARLVALVRKLGGPP